MASTSTSISDKPDADNKRGSVSTDTNELLPAYRGTSTGSSAAGPRFKTLPDPSRPFKEEDETWLWEITGCAVSVIALGLIVLVLALVDGKSLPHLPWRVKLGSVLSVLVIFLEAGASLSFASCMCQIMWIRFRKRHCSLTDIDLYEGASRGIWGSVKLLFSGRAGFKGLIGILVCAMLLATGPFTQNTLGTRQKAGDAFIHRCEEIGPGISGILYRGFTASLMSNDWDPSGSHQVFDPYLQGLNTDCPSGNCDWPTYNSLAICSQCDDYSNLVKNECAFQYGFNSDTSEFVCNRTLNIAGTNLKINNYTINDWDLSIDAYYDWNNPIFIDVESDQNIPTGFPTAEYVYVNPLTGSFDGVQLEAFTVLRNLPLDNGQYEASHCTLYYCVQAYNTTVRNFTLSQDIVASWHPTHPGIDEVADSNETTFLSPLPEVWPSLNITAPTNFTVWCDSFTNVSEWLSPALTGQYMYNLEISPRTGYYTNGSGGAFAEAIYENLVSNPHGTVDSLFKFVTDRMTNAWLATCPKNISAIGTVYDLEEVINVEWAWLALPTMVVLVSVAFLAVVISECRRDDINLWKNYALPKLYYGVAPELHQAFDSGVDDFNRMKKKVKDVKVKLERNENGDWWFVAEDRGS